MNAIVSVAGLNQSVTSSFAKTKVYNLDLKPRTGSKRKLSQNIKWRLSFGFKPSLKPDLQLKLKFGSKPNLS